MKKLYLILTLLQGLLLSAQNPADVDLTFGAYPGFDNGVSSICQQPDGKILIGGSFSNYKGQSQNNLIRLNPDGTKDNSFDIGLGLNGTVNTICLQSDGKILIGGGFNYFQGQIQNNLIRLNPDGSKDNTFDIGTGFNNSINAISLQPDGKIFIGGKFSTYQGLTQNGIIRLNADGTKDNSFNIGSGFNVNDNIWTICIQSDGKIIASGQITAYQEQNQYSLIRLNPDGTKDNSFNVDQISFNVNQSSLGYIYKIYLQQDGKILLGGQFNFNAHCVIRLNQDGSRDDSFFIYNGLNSTPNTICQQPDGKILIGGSQVQTQTGLIRLYPNGYLDNSFNIGTGFSDNAYANAICVQQDGKILVGGGFATYQGQTQNNLVLLNSNGSIDNSLNTGNGLNESINSTCIQPDGKIITGGSFDTYQGKVQRRLIRFNSDGTRDTSFNIGTGFNGTVMSICLQPNGKIVVAGTFTQYQDQTQYNLIRLNPDGTKDTSFNSSAVFTNYSSDFNNYVKTICLQQDGKILVGGYFYDSQWTIHNIFIRLNPDGTKDTSFDIGTGFDSAISTIYLQPDEKILVSGAFKSYQGQPQNGLIRLNPDGSIDNSFNIGSGFNYPTITICIQSDGKILVGGGFTTYQGEDQSTLLRLNTDGTIDSSFDIGSGFNYTGYPPSSPLVNIIHLQEDGKILIGGTFTSFQGQSQNNFIRLNQNGTKDDSFDIGTGFYGTKFNNNLSPHSPVSTICIQSDGKILIGGQFNTYQTTNLSSSLIRLKGDESYLSANKFQIENKFNFYPNPVKDKIIISSSDNSEIESLEVYDLSGKLILKSENTKNTLNVSHLNKGVYLLKIYKDGNCETHKFIKE